ncbi:MAG: membrane protein insertion efficiency factor YidD [Spirochaetota bacterium]
MKIKLIALLATLIFIVFSMPSYSTEKFGPWDPDVSVADENIAIKIKHSARPVSIFSAPAAGAFFMIRGFQKFISPQDGPNCRFRPTCSEYGRIAVLRYGAVVGAFLAGDRLIRCNPYNAPGRDPVPEFLFK